MLFCCDHHDSAAGQGNTTASAVCIHWTNRNVMKFLYSTFICPTDDHVHIIFCYIFVYIVKYNQQKKENFLPVCKDPVWSGFMDARFFHKWSGGNSYHTEYKHRRIRLTCETTVYSYIVILMRNFKHSCQPCLVLIWTRPRVIYIQNRLVMV